MMKSDASTAPMERTGRSAPAHAGGGRVHACSNRHGIAYDMPIVLNERQAGPAIEGVERCNAELRGDAAG